MKSRACVDPRQHHTHWRGGKMVPDTRWTTVPLLRLSDVEDKDLHDRWEPSEPPQSFVKLELVTHILFLSML